MAAGAPARYSSQAYKASDVILAAPLTLQMASGFNPQVVDLFLLFFDKVAVPVGGTVPTYPLRVPAGGSYSWAYQDLVEGGQEGKGFNFGCCFGVSTTGNVYTPSLLGFWVDAYGRHRT